MGFTDDVGVTDDVVVTDIRDITDITDDVEVRDDVIKMTLLQFFGHIFLNNGLIQKINKEIKAKDFLYQSLVWCFLALFDAMGVCCF